MNLNQRKFLRTKVFSIREKSFHVKDGTFFESAEFEVPFDEVLYDKIVKQTTTGILPVLSFIFFLFLFLLFFLFKIFSDIEVESGVLVFMFFLSSISFLLAAIIRKKIILIPTLNSGAIEIFDRKSKSKYTEDFIEELKKRIMKFLKTKYSKIDEALPVDSQLDKIIWLKDIDVLSDVEFEELKNKLINHKKSNKNIGFNR